MPDPPTQSRREPAVSSRAFSNSETGPSPKADLGDHANDLGHDPPQNALRRHQVPKL